MAVEIIRGTNKKPAATEALVAAFQALGDLEGQLWVGYPLLGGIEETYPVDAAFFSPLHGVVAIDLVEGDELEGFEDRQEALVRLLNSRLLLHKALVRKGVLQVPTEAISFAPVLHPAWKAKQDEYVLCGPETLEEALAGLIDSKLTGEAYEQLLSAVQNLTGLRNARKPRAVNDEDSRGSHLQNLEKSIATLDRQQSAAVIGTTDDVQRIRGLAGSGKTIVLALKAAYLHAYHPDWQIAVTYNARALHDQFVRLIRRFFIDQTGEEPDWEKLHVMNAWGGRGTKSRGIYADFCKANAVPFMDYRYASQMFGSQGAFEEACSEALRSVESPQKVFDAILVDEAQDFPPSFLRLCYRMLGEKKRLVYAYDELQNLSGKGMASPEEIFGVDPAGQPLVSFENSRDAAGVMRDIVLERCYRNSRPVLVTAHALGFGVYRTPSEAAGTGLVQMFDKPELWEEIGYRTVAGSLEPGQPVELQRTSTSSPSFLESHSPASDIIEFHCFDTVAEQDRWVADQIRLNIENDELRHEDIMVVNPNPLTARENLGPMRKTLLEAGIANHLAGVDTAADVFFHRDDDSVTFTGIFRAKGNEAGMVYVVNAQEGEGTSANLAQVRNRLFTAITRSKAWVRVAGVGPEMKSLKEEFERVRDARFTLRFVYPTESQREKLRILHREVTPDVQKNIDTRNVSVRALLEDLQSEKLFVQDLDAEVREQLRALLNREDG